MFDENKNYPGSITQPMHVITDTHDEHTKRLEENIRDSKAFRDKWQTYIEGNRLKIPDEYITHFQSGGTITIAEDRYLMLFGSTHWSLYQRWLVQKLRVDPTNRLIRKIYRTAYRFSKPDDEGFITIDPALCRYANLFNEVALIGMVYHFEVHNKGQYLHLEGAPKKRRLMDIFSVFKHNK